MHKNAINAKSYLSTSWPTEKTFLNSHVRQLNRKRGALKSAVKFLKKCCARKCKSRTLKSV
jgi:hypothetical protein